MSTVKTNTLQTLDGAASVEVAQIVEVSEAPVIGEAPIWTARNGRRFP